MARGMHFSGVKAVVTKKYAAMDGKEFETPEEAAAHNTKGVFKPLHRGLNEATIEAMLRGEEKPLAGLIEKLASKLEKVRKSDPSYIPRPRAKKGNGADEAAHVL